MTVVEFFDKNAIENIVSTLLIKPKKVYFIGGSEKQMNAAIKNYKIVSGKRSIDTEMECVGVEKKLPKIVEELTKIVDESDECGFDLTGGDEIYLVAVGMIYSKFPDKVKLYRFNIFKGSLNKCDENGCQIHSLPADLTVEENMLIYGGKVMFKDENPKGSERWDFNEEFCRDIVSVWDICKSCPNEWNNIVNCFDRLNSYFCDKNSNLVEIDKKTAEGLIYAKGNDPRDVFEFINKLKQKKMIHSYVSNNKTVSFEYKNTQIKHALIGAGKILELFVTIKLKETNLYNDILTGVFIDWDGVVNLTNTNVGNEIDVVAMKGMIPIFISCKNGQVLVEELYKLNTVAERFGGDYARKILIVSDFDKIDAIKTRADEMNIKVIANFDDKKLEKELKNLINN